MQAWEAADIDGLVRILSDDITWTMPPWREWYAGREPVAAFLRWVWRPDGQTRSRLVATAANGQPAFGYYRASGGAAVLQPFAIQVLSLEPDAITSITNFVDAGLFSAFGLPVRMAADADERSPAWIHD